MHANVHVGQSEETRVQHHRFINEAGESVSFLRRAEVKHTLKLYRFFRLSILDLSM